MAFVTSASVFGSASMSSTGTCGNVAMASLF